MKKHKKEFSQFCYVCNKRTKWMTFSDQQHNQVFAQCSQCECTEEDQIDFKHHKKK